MPIIKWKPFHEIEEFFEKFPFFSFRVHTWDLAVNVHEDKDNVVVEIHIPGIDLGQTDIEAEDNYLCISGSREEKEKIKNKHYYRKEIKYGSFERIIELPCSIIGKETKTEFKDGVLKVTLPKQKRNKKASNIKIIKS